jgi:hypothetical protein
LGVGVKPLETGVWLIYRGKAMKLNGQQNKQLEKASCIGKEVKFVYPESGETTWGKVVDEVSTITSHYKNILQRIGLPEAHEDGSKYAYRFGYYVYSFKAKRVIWAQRPLLVTSKECQDLLAQARKKGWDFLRDE